jgi:hypothetical protein
MKTHIINKIISLVLGVVLLTSCAKWLDVSPKAQIKEADQFSSEQGFKDALFGVYQKAGSTSLYGDNLTMGLLSVLAQNYSNTTGSSNNFYQAGRYNYTDLTLKPKIDAIWNSAYSTIAQINLILKNVDAQKSVMTSQNYNLIKGEALGMRAYLHFDLLRMYAPAVVTGVDPPAIPYMKDYTITAQPKSTVGQVLSAVEADLLSADQLLSVYPNIDQLNTYLTNSVAMDIDNFLMYRQNRFNCWAAKALLARMYLYKGDNVKAASYATQVIASNMFRFNTTAELNADKTKADNAFSTDLIFSLYVSGLKATSDAYFTETTAGTSTNNRLELTTARLGTLYEIASGGSSDVRYNKQWLTSGAGKYCAKYWQYIETNMALRNLVPMIRLSEMYLILAEVNSDLASVNVIRTARALNPLASTTDLTNEVRKEYEKDLYAEGQIYFYYKRKGTVRIPNASVNAVYQFPLPNEEITFGK